jgi:hypothetical protein
MHKSLKVGGKYAPLLMELGLFLNKNHFLHKHSVKETNKKGFELAFI